MRLAKTDELHLSPLEQNNRIAALVPTPRTHRYRYFSVEDIKASRAFYEKLDFKQVAGKLEQI